MAIIKTADGEKSVYQWHHCLKIWPGHFELVARGLKTAEFRLNDRGFEVGDFLDLAEFQPEFQRFTGRKVLACITHVLDGGFGMPDGYAMLSIQLVQVWL